MTSPERIAQAGEAQTLAHHSAAARALVRAIERRRVGHLSHRDDRAAYRALAIPCPLGVPPHLPILPPDQWLYEGESANLCDDGFDED